MYAWKNMDMLALISPCISCSFPSCVWIHWSVAERILRCMQCTGTRKMCERRKKLYFILLLWLKCQSLLHCYRQTLHNTYTKGMKWNLFMQLHNHSSYPFVYTVGNAELPSRPHCTSLPCTTPLLLLQCWNHSELSTVGWQQFSKLNSCRNNSKTINICAISALLSPYTIQTV